MKKKNYPLQLLTCITYRDEVKSVELDQKFNFNNTHSGICFCVPVDAISSDLLAFLNLNGEVKND